MSFDGLFIKHLITELNENLLHYRVQKITQVDEKMFLFSFYHAKKSKFLLFDISAQSSSVYLTEKSLNASLSSSFLDVLKRHLEGSLLVDIMQHETDRVFIFTFQMNDFLDGRIEKKLVFEAMGRHSNLILIKDLHIIDTYKKMFFESGRHLIPKAEFNFFPSNKKPFSQMTAKDLIDSIYLVEHFSGISKPLADFLISNQVLPLDLVFKPTLTENGKFYCVDIFDKEPKKYFTSLSKCLDERVILPKDYKSSYHQFLSNFIKKNEKKLLSLQNELLTAEEHFKYKDYADNLYASGLNLKSYISSYKDVTLDITKTINENAQSFYKKYQKSKRSQDHLLEQITLTKQFLLDAEELQFYLEIASIEDLNDFENDLTILGYKKRKTLSKKREKKKILSFVINQNISIFVGKNQHQNAYLTHDFAQKEDYWFHVKDAPGSHVIVKSPILNEETLRVSAMLAAYYSPLKNSSSIPVNYTQIKHVHKIKGLLGHQVSIKNYKTIYIDIDDDMVHKLHSK